MFLCAAVFLFECWFVNLMTTGPNHTHTQMVFVLMVLFCCILILTLILLHTDSVMCHFALKPQCSRMTTCSWLVGVEENAALYHEVTPCVEQWCGKKKTTHNFLKHLSSASFFVPSCPSYRKANGQNCTLANGTMLTSCSSLPPCCCSALCKMRDHFTTNHLNIWINNFRLKLQ